MYITEERMILLDTEVSFPLPPPLPCVPPQLQLSMAVVRIGLV